MKNLLTPLSFTLLTLLGIHARANTYYVSTTGIDSNPGTIDKPFASWQKLSSVLKAGDIAYIRGGTYRSLIAPGNSSTYLLDWTFTGSSGSHITISNYPGESPVFNMDNFTSLNVFRVGVHVFNCTYTDFVGLRFTGLPQIAGSPQQNSEGTRIEGGSNITFTSCEWDHIQGVGCRVTQNTPTSATVTFKNCDSHHNGDPRDGGGGVYGNADGFDANGGTVTYIGCRAWWNSDDGFDAFYNDAMVTYTNCWSFWNGYIPGSFTNPGSQADGMGFKWGLTTTAQPTTVLRRYERCISFQNKTYGFDQNTAKCIAQFYNCTSYKNVQAWAMNYSMGGSSAEPNVLKNCISFSDGTAISNMTNLVQDHNTWNNITASTSSFATMDTTGVTGPRQSDGSLPNVQFLHLSSGSNMINAGVSVADIQYSGSAPDLGAFEFGGSGSAANQPPNANAGSDQIFFLPTSSTTLSGSGSDPDGTIASYQWTKISGPSQYTLSAPTLAKTNVSNLVEGQYQFELKVTDNLGAVGKDTVTITVNQATNQSPIAQAGNSQSITLPTNSVTVDGSSSSDPDGTIASYLWTKILGPTSGVIANPNAATTNITGLVQGVYQFELKVTDNSGAVGKDTVQITVGGAPNQPPVADAGLDINITLPTNSVTLSGSGSDPDGTVASDQWTKISGPSQYTIASAGQAQTSVNNLVEGTYAFELKVTDNAGATDRDTVKVIVNPSPTPNQPPTADAGSDISITLPTNSVTLSGSGTDADGTVASYQWNKISGPSQYNIVSPTGAQTAVSNLAQGTYQFQLTVMDNAGASATDIVQVTVNAVPNQLPVADAGADIVITLPTNSVTLSGSGTDADGTVASYQWNKISGPSQYNIVSTTASQTTVSNLAQGTYQFQLTVTDNAGGSATDMVQVTVNPAPNQLPVADAGPDIVITLPTNSVTLSGSGSDADGFIESYQWSKISGPGQYTIAFPTRTRTTIDGLVEGVYQFQLQVTDNSGAIATDIVQVTVNGATPQPNQNPTANAGTDLTITLPTNNVTLNGTGSDPDGSIASYQWTMISGPSQYDIVSATQGRTSVNNLTSGVYQFQLEVIDNLGASSVDVVQITVNAAAPPPNQSPTADAGADITITLPANTVTLSGSGTDPDGTIASYQWNKVSGPGQYNVASPATAQTSVDGLVQGVYTFELTVTDNAGATAKDNVQVFVNAAPNQSPSLSAGADVVLTLPTNSTTLSGSGTDPDGWMASYQWRKISGPSQYTIASPNSAQTSVTNLVEGVYAFECTGTDNSGATAKDTVLVTVKAAANQAPEANAGPDVQITLPTNSARLSGSGSDPDGTIVSYRWRAILGPTAFTINSSTRASTTVSGLVQGVYNFELTVTDNGGATDRDTVIVTVLAAPINQAPKANAGADIILVLPTNSTTLSGSGSDPDGSISSYQWRKIAGPSQYNVNSSNRAQTSVRGLVQGVYQFELTVTDNAGKTGKDTVQVTVNAAAANQAPKANAGLDINVTLPTNSANLLGSGSDVDGTISSYRWNKISGPSQYNIASSTQAQTAVNNLAEGSYQFELTVTDNSGKTGKDTVQVIVNPESLSANHAPTAEAGSNVDITLPTNSVELTGKGKDIDGTITSYKWKKISGPAQYSIASASKAQTQVTGLVQGVYQFELTVTDNSNGSGTSTMEVTVHAAPNEAPVANAGSDLQISLPTDTVSLTGTGSIDPDGTIASYKWAKVSGPAQSTIASPSKAQTLVGSLTEGVYEFELTVTDNAGASAKDTVELIVLAVPKAFAKVFPNPATDVINIQIEGAKQTSSTALRIYDNKGNLVYHEDFIRPTQPMIKRVDISGLPGGIYFAELQTETSSITTLRFIKK